MSDVIGILVCDDAESAVEDDWQRLHAHASQDGGAPFERVGKAMSASEAIYEGERRLADVILIDLVMPKFQYGPRVLAGPWIARALTAFYASSNSPFRPEKSKPDDPRPRAPRLALWTSNPLETVRCEVHAFVTLGGRDVVNKQDTTQKQVEAIRRVVSTDQRWQPADGLPDALREMLAYYDAGYSNADTAGALSVTTKSVEHRINRLRNALGVAPDAAYGAGPVLAAARRQGVSWVPLDYRATPPKNDPLGLAR